MKKKAQIFYLDFIIGLTLFLIVAFIAFKIISTDNFTETNIFEETEKISNYLMSEGIPKNWTKEDFLILGLLSNNSLDYEKLKNFYYLCELNYSSVKKSFSLKQDFYIYFESLENNTINFFFDEYNVSYFCINMTKNNLTQNNIIKKENFFTDIRFLIYHHNNISEIIKMKIVVFE
ncbi:MAG: hypothetical protein QW757_00755 [Candidatus Woesearchaeota archaeon]